MYIYQWIVPNVLSLFRYTGLVLLHLINHLNPLLQLLISFSVSTFNTPFILLNLHYAVRICTLFIAVSSSANAKYLFIYIELRLPFALFALFAFHFTTSGVSPFYPA